MLFANPLAVAGFVPEHLIEVLPGQPVKLLSRHFSGYLDIGEGRHVFYWFIESESNPSEDPVIFWTNGGPGCSSMEGVLSEHGPFNLDNDDGTMTRNPYAWTRVANMLYVEQPLGVGFSFADTEQHITDESSAALNLLTLLKFFELYREFSKNKFYISGESYAGIYCPLLAEQVLHHNRDHAAERHINLAGLFVGNGCTGKASPSCGLSPAIETFEESPAGLEIALAYNHGLVGRSAFERIGTTCAGLVVDTEIQCVNVTTAGDEEDCWRLNETHWWCDITNTSDRVFGCCKALEDRYESMGTIDVYNVYAKCPLLKHSSQHRGRRIMWPVRKSRSRLRNPLVEFSDMPTSPRTTSGVMSGRSFGRLNGKEPRSRHKADHERLRKQRRYGFDGCDGDSVAMTDWLNRPDVRRALHVPESASQNPGPGTWAACNDYPKFNYTSTVLDLVPTYASFVAEKVKVCVFSGDVDDAVPTASTAQWVQSISTDKNWEPLQRWGPWYVENQVAGYISSFATTGEMFTFATIHGAGHMVPTDKPRQALALLWSFLTGAKIDSTYGETRVLSFKGSNDQSYSPGQEIIISSGTTFSLSVATDIKDSCKGAAEQPMVGFQWFRDGGLMVNESAMTLNLGVVSHCMIGEYAVIASCVDGSEGTAKIRLRVVSSSPNSNNESQSCSDRSSPNGGLSYAWVVLLVVLAVVAGYLVGKSQQPNDSRSDSVRTMRAGASVELSQVDQSANRS